MDADQVVSFKALNVDEAYASSFRQLGYQDIETEDLVFDEALA
jgi:hypothetical protein